MTQASPTPSVFCWNELGTTNAKAAKDFYTKWFGWSTADQDMGEMGTYTMLRLGQAELGGMYQLSGPMFEGVPSHWMFYVSVANVDAAVAQVIKLGGKIVMPAMDIPDVGRMALFEDPTGAKLAVFQRGKHTGTQADPMTPGAFCWVELHTPDPAKAQKFYTQLFGWTAKSNAPKADYTEWLPKGAEQPIGGMLKLDPNMGPMPPCWLGYVTVADCDASVKKAQSLKGKVLVPPMDIPKVGRFSVVQDPTGAAVAVIKLDLSAH